MREPLLWPALAFAAGIAAQRQLGWQPGELWPGLLALVAIALFTHRRGMQVAAAVSCLAGVGVAGALRLAAVAKLPPPELDAAPRELLVFTGCIVKPPVRAQDRMQVLLELAPGARARVNFYASPAHPPPELRYGQRIEFEGRARRARSFRNPGAFDYAAYLARRNVYWTITASRNTELRVIAEDCGDWLHRQLHRLRAAIQARIRHIFPSESGAAAMLEAVLIGSDSGLDPAWTESWQRTGTYHALVVSGLQVGVLATVFLFLLRMCMAPESVALTLTAGAAWLYAMLCGADPPVVRAAAGFTIFALARWLYRKVRLLNLLAAVALLFLLADPEQLFDPSFQLSFLAVAAIAALALPLLEASSAPLAKALVALEDRTRDPVLEPRVAAARVELRLLVETLALWTGLAERWASRLLRWPLRAALFLFDLLVVSAAVQLALVLPMALYFHRLPLTGLSANLVVGPLMSAAVPVGLAAVLTAWSLPVWASQFLLATSQKAVEIHSAWEPNWRVPDPPLWVSSSLAIVMVCLAWTLRRRRRLALVALGAAAGLIVVLLVHPFPPDIQRGKLELCMLDVGQAESLFLAFPDGSLAMVDGGGFPGPAAARQSKMDIGENVVSPYLWKRGVRRLDLVVATHGHSDHIGGLCALLENFRPRQFWFGPMPDTPSWRQLRAAACRVGARMVRLEAGQRFSVGGALVEVLAPPPGYEPGPQPHNNDSVVLQLSYGRHCWLLTGDIERQVERALIADGKLRKIQVLKVPHHGSRTAAGDAFLELTRPALALISAGPENPYNLPHPALLERLAERKILALRTDRHGFIRLVGDGRRLELDTMCWGDQ